MSAELCLQRFYYTAAVLTPELVYFDELRVVIYKYYVLACFQTQIGQRLLPQMEAQEFPSA